MFYFKLTIISFQMCVTVKTVCFQQQSDGEGLYNTLK